MTETCQLCGEGVATQRVDYNLLYLNPKGVTVQSLYNECDTCGGEYATAKQVAFNKNKVKGYE